MSDRTDLDLFDAPQPNYEFQLTGYQQQQHHTKASLFELLQGDNYQVQQQCLEGNFRNFLPLDDSQSSN